ncbi:CheY-like chemotaxis protein [Flavobacterium arsenatis]|uniref:CheY-like chemotaxis protein n=1 Tax=Flavobacterium arsenatis TaxID=1484332 RepID=A0ABU1TPJ0_9FLAO|nr:response regulator [Flavobacterium arsenatis]MDR6967811.1 CheY-like chemotaxis protein [Flavobacterium arsenatis]
MQLQKPLRIIIADDDFDEIDLLKIAFEKSSSFEIIACVNNGQEIIDAVKKNNKRPDVILTDMYMPILNGLEATEILRMNEENASISVIIFSTTINPSITEKASHLGIVGTLLKPFMMDDYQGLPNKVVEMLNSKVS